MRTDSRSSKRTTFVAVLAAVAVAGCASQQTGSEGASSEKAPPIQASEGQELFGHYQRPDTAMRTRLRRSQNWSMSSSYGQKTHPAFLVSKNLSITMGTNL